MKFPLDQLLVPHERTEKRMSEQIADLKTIAELIRELSSRKERDFAKWH
jgi:hypothetical protein